MSNSALAQPTEPQHLRLHYQLRFRDYWLFHCLSQLCSPVNQALLLLCGAAFGIWLRAEGATWLWAGVAALAAYAAFWLLQCGFNAIYLISRNNRAVLREHGVTVSAEGLRDSTDVYEHLLRWPGVARVANYGWVVAVYSSAVDAVVLPRSAFASPAQAAQWVACVRAAARSGL